MSGTDDFLRDDEGRIVPFDECPPEEQVRRRFFVWGVLGQSWRDTEGGTE